ncbi:MAG: DUF2269 domain-containing protein [Actinomycetota bacterium]|nr:DUF2269 domain-containing protein [Actinomycetota bacterium]
MSDITRYELLLFLHILMAITWVGGALATQFFALRLVNGGSPETQASFAKSSEWVGMRVFMPASLILLLSGIGLVAEGNWGFTTLWVLIGLAAYLFSFLSGVFFLGPESGRLGKAMEEKGPADPEVRGRIKRLFAYSRIELGVLILIVLDMTVKPGA